MFGFWNESKVMEMLLQSYIWTNNTIPVSFKLVLEIKTQPFLVDMSKNRFKVEWMQMDTKRFKLCIAPTCNDFNGPISSNFNKQSDR